MAITGISGISSSSESTVNGVTVAEDKNALSTDDFYALLAAQLQNQTMYDTVDNSEYIAQMVQFSLLSQMQEMASGMQRSYAVSLLGKNVDLAVTDASGAVSVVSGTVEKVYSESGVSYVCIDGVYYEAESVLQVNSSSSSASSSTDSGTATDTTTQTDAVEQTTEDIQTDSNSQIPDWLTV